MLYYVQLDAKLKILLQVNKENKMETLAKMCEECLPYVSGNCDGKEQASVKAGKKPCNKYVFATDELIGNLDNELEETLEPTDEQIEAVEPAQIEPQAEKIDNSLAVLGSTIKTKTRSTAFGSKPVEMKKADFQRLSAPRANKAIAAIKLIGNLNNKYAYAWDAENVQALRAMLENTIKDVFGQF